MVEAVEMKVDCLCAIQLFDQHVSKQTAKRSRVSRFMEGGITFFYDSDMDHIDVYSETNA